MTVQSAAYRHFCRIVPFAILLGAQAALPAGATPLDKSTCAKLALDLKNLKALDVDKLMAKGPSWAADHLSAGDLALVRQYIDLDEQVKFRCTAPSALVHLKRLDDDDETSGAKASADEGGAHKKNEADDEKPKPKAKAAKASEKAKRPADAVSAGSR